MMISFFFPALSLILVSLLLLLALKAAFKEILPSNSNIVKAISVFLVLCACIYAGMIGGHYLSRPASLWIGDILPICGVTLFIWIFCKDLTLSELGVCLPNPTKIVTTTVLVLFLGATAWGSARYFSFHQDFSLNRFIFMLTISGVYEELVFRGAMPSLLKTKCNSSCRYGMINRIIVFLVPTVIFTLIHAIRFTDGHFSFSGYIFGVIGAGACAFMYLRQKTGSLLNSIISHNILNAGTVIVLGSA
jgi:membrane protease YdiL (CAAX protease family)